MHDLGFISNCLTGRFVDKLRVAHDAGYNTMEVACWPKGNQKQCDLDADNYTTFNVFNIKFLLKQYNMKISTLAYYDNMLEHDSTKRKQNLQHLKNVINLASELEVPYVATYIGQDLSLSLEDNFVQYQQIFSGLLTYAEENNVTVLIENCPMPTWNNGLPATISYSPEFWNRMFELLPNKNYGLNLDVSHLYWLHIDVLKAIEDYSNRIYSIHVKDVTLKQNNEGRYGIYGKVLDRNNPNDFGYYQPTLPGYGDIKWETVMCKLDEVGFDGPIQVEYKNSNGYGHITSTEKGLKMSAEYLKCILENSSQMNSNSTKLKQVVNL